MKKSLNLFISYLVPVLVVVLVVLCCVIFLINNLPYDDDDLSFITDSEKIVVSDTLVFTDTMGINLSNDTAKNGVAGYVEFEVKSMVDGKIQYEIFLTKENADPEISMNFVKVYLTDENDQALDGFNFSSVPTFYDLRVAEQDPSGRLLYSGYLKNKGSRKFKLRMWTADSYGLNVVQNIFSVKLNVGVK